MIAFKERFDPKGAATDTASRLQHKAARAPAHEQNLGGAERVASGLAGGALLAAGAWWTLRRGSLWGALTAAAGGALLYRGAAGYCPVCKALGVTPADATRWSHPLSRDITVHRAITINRPTGEVYRFCRDLSQMPHIFSHVEHVDVRDNRLSHWVVRFGGQRWEWDSQLIEDRPDEHIAWRSVGNPPLESSGSVRFAPAPGDRGCVVRVTLHFHPPGGVFGAALGLLRGASPSAVLAEDLRRMRQYLEAGELATNAGPSGRGAPVETHRPSRLAQALSGGAAPGMQPPVWRAPGAANDVVQEASNESFPASDAPSWTTQRRRPR